MAGVRSTSIQDSKQHDWEGNQGTVLVALPLRLHLNTVTPQQNLQIFGRVTRPRPPTGNRLRQNTQHDPSTFPTRLTFFQRLETRTPSNVRKTPSRRFISQDPCDKARCDH